MPDDPGADHPDHRDGPVPGGRVASETGAGATATRDPPASPADRAGAKKG